MRLPEGRCPTHPGEYIKEDILEEMNLTQDELASRLFVSRKTINQIVNQKQRLTTDLAMRLGMFTHTSPEMWMNLQSTYDLWNAQKGIDKTNINEIKPILDHLEEA